MNSSILNNCARIKCAFKLPRFFLSRGNYGVSFESSQLQQILYYTRAWSICTAGAQARSNICFTLQNHINQNDNGKETRKSLPAQRVPWNWLPLPDVVTCPRVGVVVVSVRVGWWVYVRWIHYLRSHHKRLTSVQLCYWRLRRGDLVLHWTAVLGMRPTANG